MKISILKESLCLGGTERSAANISKAICKNHEVYFTVYDSSKLEYAYGGKLMDLHAAPRTGALGKIYNSFIRAYRYNHFIKDKKIEILFEFISIHNPLSMLKHPNQIRIIASRNYAALEKYPQRYYKCLKRADAVLCNSEYLRNYYITHFPDQRGKAFCVYNIIDQDEINRQKLEPVDGLFLKFLSEHQRNIVAVGRFCKEKGFEYLLKSFSIARKKNPDLGLVMVGDGPFRKKYEDVIQQEKIYDHVYFTGFQSNPYKFMAKCNCFVLSSLTEGFPNVLAEAMALELPVISTNCYTGPAEILRSDRDYTAVRDSFQFCDYGILAPRMAEANNGHAVSELARAIDSLLSDEFLMQKYAALSKQRVEKFSEEEASRQLNDIFDDLVRIK